MAGDRPPLGIGLIGSGYLGKAYTLGYRSAPNVFGAELGADELELVAESTPESAELARTTLGFTRATHDWRALVADPKVDLVIVNTPNKLHLPMAMAAIRAGKHVHCEKPLALSLEGAGAMTEAAERAGVRTIVGFNYRQNPATLLAKEIIESGEIGEIVGVRATHNEDYDADPTKPATWKAKRAETGAGALFDVGSHIISIIRYLVGPITEVTADLHQVIAERSASDGSSGSVAIETEDQARFLCRFERGASGVIECSRIAWGRRMFLSYEITGTKGSLWFDQERMSELHLFTAADGWARGGFRRILVNEHHPRYAGFGMGPGHGVGFNDQKIIEAAEMLAAIRENRAASPDFREATAVQAVMDAVLRSHGTRGWERVAKGAAPA
ncbi:MAG: Gfo/Idh/MocA family protein [Geminicoccaceae bacterium]